MEQDFDSSSYYYYYKITNCILCNNTIINNGHKDDFQGVGLHPPGDNTTPESTLCGSSSSTTTTPLKDHPSSSWSEFQKGFSLMMCALLKVDNKMKVTGEEGGDDGPLAKFLAVCGSRRRRRRQPPLFPAEFQLEATINNSNSVANNPNPSSSPPCCGHCLKLLTRILRLEKLIKKYQEQQLEQVNKLRQCFSGLAKEEGVEVVERCGRNINGNGPYWKRIQEALFMASDLAERSASAPCDNNVGRNNSSTSDSQSDSESEGSPNGNSDTAAASVVDVQVKMEPEDRVGSVSPPPLHSPTLFSNGSSDSMDEASGSAAGAGAATKVDNSKPRRPHPPSSTRRGALERRGSTRLERKWNRDSSDRYSDLENAASSDDDDSIIEFHIRHLEQGATSSDDDYDEVIIISATDDEVECLASDSNESDHSEVDVVSNSKRRKIDKKLSEVDDELHCSLVEPLEEASTREATHLTDTLGAAPTPPSYLLIKEELLLLLSTPIKFSPLQFECGEAGCGAVIGGADYSTFQAMRDHITNSHFSDKYYFSQARQCPDCNETLSSHWTLRDHLSKCHKSLEAVCESCWQPVPPQELRSHSWRHKNGDEVLAALRAGEKTPPTTPKSIKEEGRIRKRLQKNKGKSKPTPPPPRLPFRCTHCSKVFPDKWGLHHHSKRHLPLSARQHFECPHCHVKLLSKRSLGDHLERIHSSNPHGSRPWICHICGKRFHYHSGQAFRNHLGVHAGDRPFICEECGLAVKTKAELKRHSAVHTNSASQFQCEACEMSYKYKKSLIRHWSRDHPEVVVMPKKRDPPQQMLI